MQKDLFGNEIIFYFRCPSTMGLLGKFILQTTLLNKGIKVVYCVDNLIGKYQKENIIPQVDYHNFDILDTAKLKKL